MTDTLQKLFGTPARLKLLRLFLFNPKHAFSAAEAAVRAQVKPAEARREFALFKQIGLIKKSRRGKNATARYQLASGFEYTSGLQNLLLNTAQRESDIYQRIRGVGTVKLLVIAGVLLGEWEEGRLDLFVVGERLNERKLREQARKLESELGKELRYTALSTEQFLYRMGMNDHLVKDIFDYPHKIVHDKLNIGLK